MKDLEYLPLIGIMAIITGLLIFIFPWLMGFLLGMFLIFYGIFRLFKRHSVTVIIITILVLYGFFVYAYVGYPEDNTLPVSEFDISPSDRILIIAPHPDDEALSSAGVISRAVSNNIPVSTVVMTIGDGFKADVDIYAKTINPTPQKFIEYGNKRHFEDIRAMNGLGLNQSNVTFLGYPDGGMQYLFDTNWDQNKLYQGVNGVNHVPYSFAYQNNASYCGESVDKNLENIIKSFKPTIIIYPGPGDSHPDHWATHAFVDYTTTRMNYRGEKLTYVIHNRYGWPFPWIFAPGRHILPPTELSELKAKWLIFNLTSDEVFSKGDCIDTFSSQKILLNPLLESFIRQNELFAVYDDIGISPNKEEVNFFKDGMPATNFKDFTWDHDSITTGLEYDKNNSWIFLETKNGIRRENTYKFHFRIFNDGNVKRADIVVQNGKITPETEAKNSIKINKSIKTQIKQDKLIVKIPSALFKNATAFMFNVDIVGNGKIDRSDWFKFDIINN